MATVRTMRWIPMVSNMRHFSTCTVAYNDNEGDLVDAELAQLNPLYLNIETLQQEIQKYSEIGNSAMVIDLSNKALQLVDQLMQKKEALSNEAAQVLDIATKQQKSEILTMRALCRLSNYNPDEQMLIEKDLRLVMDLYPNSTAFCNYGIFLHFIGKHEESIEYFDKSIEADANNNPKAYFFRAEARISVCENNGFTAQDLKQIVSDASAAIQLEYNLQDAYLIRGRSIYENSRLGNLNKFETDDEKSKIWDLKQGIADLSASIEIFPFNTASHLYRAKCYLLIGQYAEAEKDLSHIKKYRHTAFHNISDSEVEELEKSINKQASH
jgi:tetratricopeptide (TPR) repeat protein